LPGQGWLREEPARGGGEPAGGEAGLLREVGLDLAEDVIDEEAEVARALAEGRQAKDRDGEAVEEILAEAAGSHLGHQVAVGRGDHPDVDLARVRLADALDLPFLKDPQELDLGGEGELAELVEEEGAAVGRLEDALLVVGGAGEGAAGVAEEGGFDELGRERAAVDRDEGAVAAGARAVDRASEELLAGAGLAEEEDRHAAGGDLAGAVDEAGHDLGAVDDGAELRGGGGRRGALALEGGVGGAEEVGEEFGGEVEGDIGCLDAVGARGLDELGAGGSGSWRG
jgi:hypothetical protein